jgi:hypothetical protein
MNFPLWDVHRKGNCKFMIACGIRMQQLSEQSLRQHPKHIFPFMSLSGWCLHTMLPNNVAVNGGEREFGIQRRNTCINIQG